MISTSKQAIHQQIRRKKILDQKITDLLIEVCELRSQHPGCGLAKMYDTLKPNFVGRDRFIEIFTEKGFQVFKPKNRVKTTLSVHSEYENLITGAILTNINQVLQSDICYYRVKDQFYYIVFIIDVFSKRVVGYQVSDHLRATANLKALKQAVKLRGAANLKDCIHHSDRGSQYIANQYTKLLKDLECIISMGLIAQDNAYAERINGIIKNEFLKHWKINSFKQLKAAVKKAVEYYNNYRIHQHLPQKLSPIQFELALQANQIHKTQFELIYAQQNTIKRNQLAKMNYQLSCPDKLYCPIFEQ